MNTHQPGRRRVAVIGTGWGELAVRAARQGAQATSITLSAEGLSDRVTVDLCDYRDATGS
jgi:cyclopropane-fatty-acyl-phospholipid synthase